jgi:hypothetical protein
MHSQRLAALAVFVIAQSVSVPGRVVPDFRDLTIKTRRTYGEKSAGVITEILLLRGARERWERITRRPNPGEADHDTMITITQCDTRQVVYLNGEKKLYWAAPFEDGPGYVTRWRPMRQAEEAGADVEITNDSVDTGERRQVGSYIARRVLMTRKVEPSPGANTRASTDEWDGWYIDLPGLGCSNSRTEGSYSMIAGLVGPGRPHDRLHFRQLGSAPRGYAIRETTRHTEQGRTSVGQVELLESSEASLDAALFNVPSGYQPALPRVRGGFDLTQPDTLVNRLHTYWVEVVLWAGDFLR